MKQAYKQVKELLDIVSPFLKRAGVPEKARSMPTGEVDLIETQKYIDAFDMLSDMITSPEWERVQEIWNLIPPHMWANYDLFKFKGLAEQDLLKEALVELKKYWQENRTKGFYGKQIDQENHSESTSVDSVQPSGTGTAEANH